MSCERFSLLRNIGQFNSVNAGAQIPLSKLTLIYAENGRGKTTLAAILRSLKSGEPQLVDERRRLGSQHPPHIVLTIGGAPIVFQNGAWSTALPAVEVFDDAFVAANVCSGIEIDTVHRKNLHELILGVQGVMLNNQVQRHVARIEQHNRDLRIKEGAIPAAARGALDVEAFCALAADADVAAKIQDAERNLAAARSADAISKRAEFGALSLPDFEQESLNALLARNLAALEADAAVRVRTHLQSLGRGGEVWVSDGMSRIAGASQGHEHHVCPFCAQDLEGSVLIRHYQAYFSEAYKELRSALHGVEQAAEANHGGEAQAAFERAVRVAVQNREFWQGFLDVPAVDIDTAAIARAWAAARDAVLTALRAKVAAPFEPMALPEAARAAIDAYEQHRSAVLLLSTSLQACNPQIAIVKERAAGADVAALTADLARLNTVRQRYDTTIAPLCDEYLAEKAVKTATEAARVAARAALISTGRISSPRTR